MTDLFLQKRCQVEAEVKYLRDAISQLKVSISTITKGVAMSKIEVNPKDFYINLNLNPNLHLIFVEIKVESLRDFLKDFC